MYYIQYKLSHSNNDFEEVCVGKRRTKCGKIDDHNPFALIEVEENKPIQVPLAKTQQYDRELPEANKQDLKSMI